MELARTTAAGLVGTWLPVGLDVAVELALAVAVEVAITSVVWEGWAVVERLPAVGAEVAPVVITVVCVVSAAVTVLDSLLLLLEGAALLDTALLPLLDEEEVPAAAEMAKGKEYWNTAVSDSRVMRMPYVAWVPRVLLTAHEYWPAELSMPSVDGMVSIGPAETGGRRPRCPR